MRIFRIEIVVGIAIVASVGAARAADNSTENDLRCVVVAGVIGSIDDPKMQAAAPMMMAYYLGRLKGREPAIDLPSRLETAYRSLKGSGMQADLRRCGAELVDLGKETQDVGAHFKELAAREK